VSVTGLKGWRRTWPWFISGCYVDIQQDWDWESSWDIIL